MGTVVEGSGLAVTDDILVQSRNWPDYTPVARSGCALPVWSLRTPLLGSDAEATRDEIDNVIEEILPASMSSGCYELRVTTRINDRWMDVGCHVGVFSIAAMMHGATTSLLVDMDRGVLKRAKWNVQNFSRLVEAMQGVPQGSLLPPSTAAAEITGAYDLLDIVADAGIGSDLCLKLDIQGGEELCVLGGGSTVLASRFGKVLMEWHEPKLLAAALVSLEHAGYRIVFVHAHFDVLLGIDTHIIFAVQENANVSSQDSRMVG